jgi:hypothetical protein
VERIRQRAPNRFDEVDAFDANGSKQDRRQPDARQRGVAQIGRQEGGRRQKALLRAPRSDEGEGDLLASP